jgi:hypothetical protein
LEAQELERCTDGKWDLKEKYIINLTDDGPYSTFSSSKRCRFIPAAVFAMLVSTCFHLERQIA